MPEHELIDTWGHSLPSIDPSATFRAYGLNLFHNNLPSFHDFNTCHAYGAGILCLPETNVNWNLPEQHAIFQSILRRTWRHTASIVSRSPEDFLSQYQPGGTATILCANWTPRLTDKGEDHIGLGRWSFVTLRGRGTKLITIVTAYNATYTTGDTTNFWQQQRVLSHLHIQHNQHINANPRRRFI